MDTDLTHFAAHGLTLPPDGTTGHTEHNAARIWHASYGAGKPVILLHGGLGHSGNFANQIPALTDAGTRAIAIDSRGHGRSTRDARPYSYELMASDVVAVMDALGVDRAALIGWSDGACVAMELARRVPERVAGVFFFACNMDPSGTKEIDETDPLLGRCFSRHAADYKALSATPGDFQTLVGDVGAMQRAQPNWSAADLAAIRVPVARGARRIHQARPCGLSRAQHPRRHADDPARCQPLRTAAAPGCVQRGGAGLLAPPRGLMRIDPSRISPVVSQTVKRLARKSTKIRTRAGTSRDVITAWTGVGGKLQSGSTCRTAPES
jgi:pimeloyl-ACP methyl ester carboxylesterase